MIDIGGFRLERATELDPRFLEPEYPFEWAGAYPLGAGTHDLVIGHGEDDGHDHDHGHEHGHGDGHHHHHHGNKDELDVAVLPAAGLDDPAIAAVRDAAVAVFSDWERRMKEGETLIPGPTLNRLLLTGGNGAFKLSVDKPGNYLVFEGCGEEPLHIYQGGELVKPV